MVRLINDSGVLNEKIDNLDGVSFDTMIKAIHKVQDEMGITGTTAKEAATTISGSKSSMQAAFDNLLTSISMGDQTTFDKKMSEFQSSFLTYVEGNFLPALENAIGGSGALVHGILNAITKIDTADASSMVGDAENSLAEVFDGFTELAGWLMDGISDALANPATVQGGANLGKSIGKFVGSAISDLITNIGTWIPEILDFGLKFGGSLVEGLFKGFFGEETELDKIQQFLTEDIASAQYDATEATGILMYLQSLYVKEGEAVTKTKEWQDEVELLKGKYPEVAEQIQANGTDIQTNIDLAQQMVDKIKEQAIAQAQANALQAKYNMLADYSVQRSESQEKAKNAQNTINAANEFLSENVRAYARYAVDAIQREYTDENGDFFIGGADEARYNTALENLNFAYSGESVSELISLIGTLDSILSELGIEGSAGDISENDDVLNEKELKEYGEQISQAEFDLITATSEITTLDQQIAETEASIALSEQAIKSSMDTMNTNISSSTNELANSLQGASNRINALQFHHGVYVQKYAVGSDYIPYDQYAYIHKGEAVLTAAEASAYRKGGKYSQAVDYGRIGDMIADSLGSVGLYVSGDKVANLTTDRMEMNINQRKNHTLRGMGG